ncbi:MAG TPA: hypothetical protein VMR51_02095 [Patescibacteria group bacterium]|nr:hypothetical protein [Patescibacteria group bacterium]
MPSVRKTVYKQEFGPELAGDFVGWVDVREETNQYNSRLAVANVAYAKVDKKGAVYRVSRQETEGEKPLTVRESHGFLRSMGATAVGYMANRTVIEQDSFAYYCPDKMIQYRRAEDLILLNPFDIEDHYPDKSTTGKWYAGKTELLDGIKEQLKTAKAGWLWPTLYYVLARAASKESILADPAMQETTKEELAKTEKVVNLLNQQAAEDEQMHQNLTVSKKPKPIDIPQAFMTQRENARSIEDKIADLDEKSLTLRAFLRVGCQRYDNNEYMDATNPEKEGYYSVTSLTAQLDQHKVGVVINELGRELEEIVMRLKWAQKTNQQLAMLALKEVNP